MALTMFDSISVSQLPAGTGYCYAGYVNGNWPTYRQVVASFPGHHVLSIAVNSGADADCLDVENGDASPGQAAGWFARQLARGVTRPCIYASTSVIGTIISLMGAAGISRGSVRFWSAHYGAGLHLCGPGSCGWSAADGTQWTSSAMGRNLDQSVLLDNFFGAAPPPPPPHPSGYVTVNLTLPVLRVGSNDNSLPHWYVRRVQTILNAIYGHKVVVDGAYGAATETAVKAVQAQYKLTQDGIVGSGTWTVLLQG